MDSLLQHLVLYASEFRKELPKVLEAVVPQGSIINDIAKYGLMNAAKRNNVNDDVYQKWVIGNKELKDQGQHLLRDYCELVFNIAMKYVTDNNQRLDNNLRTDILKEAIAFADSYKSVTMVSQFDTPFTELTDSGSERIYTWTPFDMMFATTENGVEEGGLVPESLFVIQSFSGSGKSYAVLALGHLMKQKNVANEIWYLSTELTQGRMRRRMRYLRNNCFDARDRVFGGWTTDMLLKEMRSNPNPRRVVILDGIDSAPETLKGRDTSAYLAYLSNATEIAHQSLFTFATGQFNREGKAAVASGRNEPQVSHAAGSVEKENMADYFMSMLNRTKLENQKPVNNTSLFEFYIHKTRDFAPDITKWQCTFNFQTFEFGQPEVLGW